MIRVKNHQTPPTMRPESDLQNKTKTHSDPEGARFQFTKSLSFFGKRNDFSGADEKSKSMISGDEHIKQNDTLTATPHGMMARWRWHDGMMAWEDGTCIMLFRPLRVSKQDYLFNHRNKYLLCASSCLDVIIVLT